MITLKSNNRGGILVETTQSDRTPFVEPGQGLYAWVNKSQYKLLKEGKHDVIKFGQYGSNSEFGKVPQDTIDEYSGTTIEPIVILWAKKFSDKELKKGSAFDIEQIVNKQIGPRYENGKSTESFHTTVPTIISKVNEVLYDSKRLDSYTPRRSQLKAIKKMTKAYVKGFTDFLLGAIMRFGKNFTFLTFCYENLISKSGNILVLTNKPGVFNSLKKDIDSHVYFEGWEYFELKDIKDKDNLQLDPNKISVVACSKQLADNMVSGRGTRKFLQSINWDFSFFDECHSGTDTDNFKSLNLGLDIGFRVWASGTPFKTSVAEGFTDDNSFYYDYIDQQKDKLKGICSDAVTISTFVPGINPQFIHNPNFTDEEGFKLTKMFAYEDDKFIFGGELRKFLIEVLGKADTKSKFSPMRICQDTLDHTVWLLPPNIKMIEGLTKLIEDIAPEYKVLNASGNNITCINKVHDAIKLNNKTITLTNQRFIEGVTVPEWTGAFVLSDTESVEKYFQFIFRVTSPLKNKDKAYVFDFDPERTFEMTFDMSNAHAINNNITDSKEAIREYLDNHNIYASTSGPSFKKIDINSILNQIRETNYTSASLIKNSNKYIIPTNITGSVSDMLGGVNPINSVNITHKMVENGLTKGKNYIQSKNSSNKEQVDVNELTDVMKRITSVVATFPTLAFLSDKKNIEDAIRELDDNIIRGGVGVSKNTLLYLINNKIIDTRFINTYLGYDLAI